MLFFNKKKAILKSMNERRPLPIGRTEFEAFKERIVSACNFPVSEDSKNFAIASMVLHLPSTESHKEDAFFIHGLHKAAANETAHAIMMELQEKKKAKLASEAATTREVTPPTGVTTEAATTH